MPNQHRGRLTPEQIAEGMHAAARNACRLAEDAKVLLAQERYPSAAALAVTSIEESGKQIVLLKLALVADDAEAMRCWKNEYRKHSVKNRIAKLLPAIQGRAQTIAAFRDLLAQEPKFGQKLEEQRQLALYTDCMDNVQWSEPAQAVDGARARELVKMADALADALSHELVPPDGNTAGVVKSWVRRLGPSWGSSAKKMKEALVAWEQELQARNLPSHVLVPHGYGAAASTPAGQQTST